MMQTGKRISHPIPVRFDDRTTSRLKAASLSLGLNNVSAIIKIAVFQQLDEIETGHLILRHSSIRMPDSAVAEAVR